MSPTTTITEATPPQSSMDGTSENNTQSQTPSQHSPQQTFEMDDTPLSQAAEDETQYPTGLRFFMILLCNALVLIFVGLDTSVLATAVPSITDEFHTVADVGWYSSAFRLCSCSFQFMFGKLYKLFAVRTMFLVSVAIFMVGSLLSAVAPTSTAFVVGRAVCGLGCAGVIQGCFTMLVHVVPLRKRPMLTACLGAVESVATMAAPVLGGIIVQKLNWRWCFWINLPTGAFTFIVSAFVLKIDDRHKASNTLGWKQLISELDLLGNLFFVPSLTCLFLALSWAGTKFPWTSGTVIGLLVTFLALLALFAWDQHKRGDKATLPPRILGNRSVLAGFLFSMATNSAINVFEYYLPTYFQTIREDSAATSGYMMLAPLLGFMVGMVLCGTGISALGYYVPFMVLGSVLMPVFAGLMTTLTTSTAVGRIICYSAGLGFAGGIGFQAPQSAVQTSLPARDASLGLAVIIFAQNFGPAIFIAIAQTIFTNQLSENLRALVPGLSPGAVSQTGLTDLKTLVGPENLEKALMGLDVSLMQTWYLAVGLTCVTMVGSLAMEWKSVKDTKRD